MIFTELIIQDFGVYGGKHSFDLRPRIDDQGRTYPIILFGGKNGSGKTTILEAIRLCLYGQSSLGNRVRRADYQSYLRQRIHHNGYSDHTRNTASVALTFEHTYNGEKHLYHATRMWSVEGEAITEQIIVYKNGTNFHEIEPEHWGDFLRDLIPQGVSDLFFFDGEQIQELARDESESEALASAIRGLLGFDLVERLQNDLLVYLNKQHPENRTQLERKAHEIHTHYITLEQQWDELIQDRAHLQLKIDRNENAIKKKRDQLRAEGGFFRNEYDQLLQEQKELEDQGTRLREEIRTLAIGLLPFATTPQWLTRVRERLKHEEQLADEHITYETQQKIAHDAATRLLNPEIHRTVSVDLPNQLWNEIAIVVEKLLQPTTQPVQDVVRHNVSTQDRQHMLDWIDEALHTTPQRIHQLTQDLEKCEERKVYVSMLIKQVPNEEAINPILHDFTMLMEEKGRLNQQIASIHDQVRAMSMQKADSERQKQKIEEQLASSENTDERIRRIAQVQVTLRQYLHELTALKIAKLEQQFIHFFNVLSRKHGLIQEVKINPQTFTVTLYRQNRIAFAKSELSAGEKQLYAMALLWALRSVSGRLLPIIIDTPMGRLDSDHRQSLFDHFFPFASQQMIILSTDTEISAEMFPSLQHAVSHTFLLDFNETEARTSVHHDYFQQQHREREVTA